MTPEASRASSPSWGADQLHAGFGDRVALDGVSVRITPGSVTAVVGGDGAGKTTLLRVLAGRVAPDGGTIDMPPLTDIGFMPSTSGVWLDLSVSENVEFVGHSYGLTAAEIRTRSARLLEAAGLDGIGSRLGSQLSGGMRQKLGFVLAMLHEPSMLLLDEPSTGVDPVSRVELWRLIASAATRGAAVLMTTTYLDEAERAGSILVLDASHALYSGDPADVAAAIPGAVYDCSADADADADAGAGAGADVAGGAVGSARAKVDPGAGVGVGECLSWRRGLKVHAWSEDGTVPVAGAQRIAEPDLEDAVIALCLNRERAEALTRGSGAGLGAHVRADVHSGSGVIIGTGTGADTGSDAVLSVRTKAPTIEPSATSAVVRIANATKRFGDFVAVDKVSLNVLPGEIVGLLGANGAGKTTLIRILLGLSAVDGGSVEIFGDVPSLRTRSRLGYLAQGLGLYGELTVRQNIEFTAATFGIKDLPPLPVSLAAALGRRASEIGLGLQRQLGFYLATSHRPELLVLDEPTSGVDPLARARLWDTVHEQAEAGVGVLVTTHYMQEAEQCDRLVLMSHGSAVAAGTTDDIVGSIKTVEVSGERWSDSFAALSTAGLPTMLSGTAVRVAGASVDQVEAALGGVGGVSVRSVPATLEEALVLIDSRR